MNRPPRPQRSAETVSRARKLRHDSTYPEQLLWSRLRDRQLAGLKLRRQHPLRPFIVDFYCQEMMLAIEVDGMSHDQRATQDAQRSAYLRGPGLRVFRVTNDEVLEDVEAVLLGILRECGIDLETGQRRTDPHPGPLPEGEGENQASPHPGPLPEGEGENAASPHPNSIPEGEGESAAAGN